MIADSGLMTEIEDIVQYAMHEMQGTVNNGTEFYDLVESSLSIAPIGILPPSTEEGYFFLSDGSRSIKVYNYKMSIFQRANDRFRSLKSHFVNEWTRNFVNTYESIKLELLKARKSVSLPAVYSIETKLAYPVDTTLLPVAKRCLVRHISNTVGGK